MAPRRHARAGRPRSAVTIDRLTGLPDRAAMMDRLRRRLGGCQRPSGGALVLVDLDRFSALNHALGFAAGDAVLIEVGRRLHKIDVPQARIAARTGPDQFAVLVEEAATPRLSSIAQELLQVVADPIDVNGSGSVTPSVSIGIATIDPTDTVESVVQHAEAAERSASARGVGTVEIYDASAHAEVVAQRRLEFQLLGVAERGELELHFQPIVDLGSRRPVAIEALVRWDRPGDGRLSPGEFIGVAERCGAIVPMGYWILEHACAQAAAWNRDRAPADPLVVSVNVSAQQLRSRDFVENVDATLDRVGIDPRRVILEVTETALMADTEAMVEVLVRLGDLGVQLALDDFGTGYSSLSYLQRLPVDFVKIDRAFVSGIASEPQEWALAVAIVQLAASLGKRTIAEGIETPAQLAHLRSLGCELGQGYLFARPDELTRVRGLVDGMGTSRGRA